MTGAEIKSFVEAVSTAVDTLAIPADRKNIVFEIVIKERINKDTIEI